jgi:hypothetical protein
MPKEKQARPRLITLLTFLLLLQTPVLVFLGLNLLTDHWSFLGSWPMFWEELETAFLHVINTPGELVGEEVLLYEVLAFAVLVISAAASLVAGFTFPQGKPVSWILSLIAQIGVLLCGIALYFISRPPQAYWLLGVGIIMVLYLNYGHVRQWFLQPEEHALEEAHV